MTSTMNSPDGVIATAELASAHQRDAGFVRSRAPEDIRQRLRDQRTSLEPADMRQAAHLLDNDLLGDAELGAMVAWDLMLRRVASDPKRGMDLTKAAEYLVDQPQLRTLHEATLVTAMIASRQLPAVLDLLPQLTSSARDDYALALQKRLQECRSGRDLCCAVMIVIHSLATPAAQHQLQLQLARAVTAAGDGVLIDAEAAAASMSENAYEEFISYMDTITSLVSTPVSSS